MKILKLLNENSNITFRDLSSIQTASLLKAINGNIPEDPSPREMAVLDSLIDLGLLNDIYEPTDTGLDVGEIAKKYNSSNSVYDSSNKEDGDFGFDDLNKNDDISIDIEDIDGDDDVDDNIGDDLDYRFIK